MLKSCSKAIVIGYIYSVVRNVMISNCIIRESNRGLCIMCHDQCALVENVRVTNCFFDTRIRAGNWWGNGEPILMMAVRHDMHLPFPQKPDRMTDCAIRGVHLDGITCCGENAMGIVGWQDNIQDVSLHNIRYTRKPSHNLPLKGLRFDLAPSDVKVDVPEGCGLLITGAKGVDVQNVDTEKWLIIRNEMIHLSPQMGKPAWGGSAAGCRSHCLCMGVSNPRKPEKILLKYSDVLYNSCVQQEPPSDAERKD